MMKREILLTIIIGTILMASSPVTAGTWLEKQKLLASDGSDYDFFSNSVSISGNYAIIGAYRDDDNGNNSGSAYIFERDGISWVQQQKLIASDSEAEEAFGYSVSISGDYAIVGACYDNDNGSVSGSAYIFIYNGTSWVEQQKLLASDGVAGDVFGGSVYISGNLAIVGADGDTENGSWSGSVYIFKYNGTSWVEQQKLLASDGVAEDYFGKSVSINNNYAIVSAYHNDDNGNNSGSAYIFEFNGTNWIQKTKLLASDGAAGDQFGKSVSISSDFAIVGANGDDDNGSGSGSAYIYEFNGTNWVEQQKLLASDGAADDYFGYSVSISGDLAIVGSPDSDDKAESSGSAYIFKFDGTNWNEEVKLLAADSSATDYFGTCVYISEDSAIIAAPNEDENGTDSGSAYIFVPVGTGELTLLAPNGGEKLVAGSSYDVTWDTNGVVENVFIEYSDNNGIDWTAIDTIANTGSYSWLVPEINSDQCLVWISDAGYPAAGDVSVDVFRIYVCTLNYDLNHDCFVDFYDFGLFASEWLQCGDPCNPVCVSE